MAGVVFMGIAFVSVFCFMLGGVLFATGAFYGTYALASPPPPLRSR